MQDYSNLTRAQLISNIVSIEKELSSCIAESEAKAAEYVKEERIKHEQQYGNTTYFVSPEYPIRTGYLEGTIEGILKDLREGYYNNLN